MKLECKQHIRIRFKDRLFNNKKNTSAFLGFFHKCCGTHVNYSSDPRNPVYTIHIKYFPLQFSSNSKNNKFCLGQITNRFFFFYALPSKDISFPFVSNTSEPQSNEMTNRKGYVLNLT